MVETTLANTPYRLVRRLSPIEVELAYGDIHERWLRIPTPEMHHSAYRIVIGRTPYCFAGQIKTSPAK